MLAVLLTGGAVALYIVISGQGVPTRGPSMRPSLGINQPIDLETGAYGESGPQLGDIVALQAPLGFETGECGGERQTGSACSLAVDEYSRTRLVKRIVGIPGDEIAFRANGSLVRNGALQDEPYILECPGTCALPRPITVPAAHFFVAGDNRPKSSDSRIWGPVSAGSIDGRVQPRGN